VDDLGPECCNRFLQLLDRAFRARSRNGKMVHLEAWQWGIARESNAMASRLQAFDQRPRLGPDAAQQRRRRFVENEDSHLLVAFPAALARWLWILTRSSCRREPPLAQVFPGVGQLLQSVP